MKKITLYFMAICLSLTFVPALSNAANIVSDSTSMVDTKSEEATKANSLLLRLNEIKAMDKSALSSSEKKDLRKEVRSIRQQLKDTGRGVYLSVGAIIIIILLLIILL